MAESRRVCAAWFLLLILFNLLCGGLCSSKFSIGHINVCGLLGKIDLFSLFVVERNFKIFCVSETLLNTSIPTSLVDIPGFVFERKDRINAGGGVGIYLKGDTNYLRRHDFENSQTEFICLEILQKHSKPYFICVLYKPPNSSKHLNKNSNEIFNDTLLKMARENKETIIIGDANSNYLDKKCDKPFKNLLSLNGFIQLIDSPTRTTPHSQTLIDVIFSNKPESLTDTKVKGHIGPHRWFFDRCTQTALGIGLKFYDFSSNFIPG